VYFVQTTFIVDPSNSEHVEWLAKFRQLVDAAPTTATTQVTTLEDAFEGRDVAMNMLARFLVETGHKSYTFTSDVKRRWRMLVRIHARRFGRELPDGHNDFDEIALPILDLKKLHPSDFIGLRAGVATRKQLAAFIAWLQ
jgi:hypothetical protein